MSQDQFTKLFNYMQREFAEIKEALATKADKKNMERVLNMLDDLAKNN